MDFQNLFLTYDGRLNRQPFWIGNIILGVGSFVVNLIVAVLFGHGLIGSVLSLIIALVLIYPGICLLIKRYHDRDKSGWWCLIVLVPVIGWIWNFIEAGCLRGTVGPNQFGPDPLPSNGLNPMAAHD